MKVKFTPAQLEFIRKTIESQMYICCTYAAQAELLRDRVMSVLRKGK